MNHNQIPLTIDAQWTAHQLDQNLSRVLSTQVCNKVLEALSQPKADFYHIANLLQSDAYIATKVIGLANMATRQSSGPIQSLDRAVQMLGLVQVKNLIFSVMLAGPLLNASGETPQRLDLRRWVLACAIANDFLSDDGKNASGGFEHLLGGLVAGLGAMVLWAGLGQTYNQILGAKLRPMTLARREKRHLGVSHYQVALWALESMQCPQELGAGVHALLNPAEDESYFHYRAVEVLGARIAGFEASAARGWLADGLPRLGYRASEVENKLKELRQRLKQLASVFDLELGDWQDEQQSRQRIMLEAGAAMQALIMDNLTMTEAMGIVQPS